MNFLFHLYLSGNDPEIMTGNLMGDFVKGRIGTEYPAGILTGLMLHRRIDSFAQENETFRRSRNRLGADYGLWRGVLVDLFYDHFLARDWTHYAEVSLGEYLREAGREVAARSRVLPGRMRSVLPMLFGEWLPSYGEISGIAGVLERMGRRVVRDNPLAGGERELLANYGNLQQDFLLFLPQVQEFAAEEIRRITRDQ